MTKIVTVKAACNRLVELAGKWRAMHDAARQHKKGSSSYPTSTGMTFGEVYAEGKMTSSGLPGSCHAYLNGGFRGKYEYDNKGRAKVVSPENPDFILSCFLGPEWSEGTVYSGQPTAKAEAIRAWVNWFVSDDNPLAKFILNRDPEFVFNNGLVIDGNAGWERSLWLAKAFRQANETPSLVDLWYTLTTQHGIDPLWAMCAAHQFPTSNMGYHVYGPDGHRCVFYSWYYDPENIILRNPAAKYPDGVRGNASAVYSKRGGHAGNGVLTGLAKNQQVPNGWGGNIPVNGVSTEQLVAKLVEIEAGVREKENAKVMASPVVPAQPVVTVTKPVVKTAAKKPVKMVRDKVTGLMRPARKRKVKVANVG